MTTLGESCQFFNGKAHEKDIDAEGKFVVVNSKFISQEARVLKFTGKQMFPLFEDDIVMVMSDVPNGKALAKCYIIAENDKYSLNQRICAIRTTEFNIRFLYYQLNRNPFFLAFNNGENQSNLRKGDILNCPLWKPSLDVQENIVELLDETFEQIAQAKDNIEKNIVNTKELFESKKEDYFNKLALENDLIPINEVCEKIFAGGDKPKENCSKTQTKELNIPIVANAVKDNGLYGYTNVAKVTKPSITVAARGSGTGHTEFRDYPFVPIVRLIVLTPKTEIVDVEFLMYAIKNLTISRSGSAIPQLTVPMIKGYSIPIPSKEIQSEIIENLNQLEIELEEYKSGLDKKILELLELKKSILQKAFIGELTQNSVAV